MQDRHQGLRVASETQDKQSISDEVLELKGSRSTWKRQVLWGRLNNHWNLTSHQFNTWDKPKLT